MKDATRGIATDIGQSMLTEGQIKGYVLGCIHNNSTAQGAAAEIAARWIGDRRDAKKDAYNAGFEAGQATPGEEPDMILPGKCHHDKELVPEYFFPPKHTDDTQCDYLSKWPNPPGWCKKEG
jgi:hypothetical protein